MKVAITSSGKDLNAQVDKRFGRAQYILLVDSETMSFQVLENKQSLNLPQGAGIQAAQNIIPHKPDVVITGNCGPKAFRVLRAAGIDVVVGGEGRVLDAVKSFIDGRLRPGARANVEGHWM